MSSDPVSDRAMIIAISRKDMVGLKRALASGANANKTLKKNQWDGNRNPLLLTAEYGWKEAFAVLVKAGAKRRAPGGTSAVAILAQAADGKGIDEIVRLLGRLTGNELAQGLDALRAVEIDQDAGAENGQYQIRQTFRALINGVPTKISTLDRARCAHAMLGLVNSNFQFAMGARRALPLEWMEELGRALPVSRRLISNNTPGIGNGLQDFTLIVETSARTQGGLPDIDQRLDLAGREFSIDLGSALEFRNQINDIVGDDARIFEKAAARQSAALMLSKVEDRATGSTPRPRM